MNSKKDVLKEKIDNAIREGCKLPISKTNIRTSIYNLISEHTTYEVNRVMGELIEWMEKDKKNYSSVVFKDVLSRCIQKAKELSGK